MRCVLAPEAKNKILSKVVLLVLNEEITTLCARPKFKEADRRTNMAAKQLDQFHQEAELMCYSYMAFVSPLTKQ